MKLFSLSLRKTKRTKNHLKIISRYPEEIKSLQLHNATVEEYTGIRHYLHSRTVPNLTELGITMWKYIQTETPVYFTDDGLHFVVSAACDSPHKISPPVIRSLKSLKLRRFILSPAPSLILVSNLEKLDISCNALSKGQLWLTLLRVFPILSTLIVSDCGLTQGDLKLAQWENYQNLDIWMYLKTKT